LTWIGIGGTMTDMNLMDAEEQRLLFNFFYLMQGADEKFEVEFGIGTTNSIKQKYPKHDGLFSQNDVFLQCEIPEDTDTGRVVHAFVGMLDQKLKRIDSSVSYEIARYGIKQTYPEAAYPYTVDFARPLLMYKLDMINEKAVRLPNNKFLTHRVLKTIIEISNRNQQTEAKRQRLFSRFGPFAHRVVLANKSISESRLDPSK